MRKIVKIELLMKMDTKEDKLGIKEGIAYLMEYWGIPYSINITEMSQPSVAALAARLSPWAVMCHGHHASVPPCHTPRHTRGSKSHKKDKPPPPLIIKKGGSCQHSLC